MIENLMSTKYAKPDKTIKQHTDDLLANLEILKNLGYLEDFRIYDLTKDACIYHDIGKVNDEFQKRVTSTKKINLDPEKEVSHNILSLYFIDKNKFTTDKDYLIVAHAVLNHHDYVDVFRAIEEKESIIKSLIEKYDTFVVKHSTKSKIAAIASDEAAIKVKGYLQKCDYAASGNYTIEYENNFLEASMSNLLKKWQIENEDANWNDMQKYCMENKDNNIIVIAQTGMGKTEAGLHWIGDEKGFFVLPIRAAINAIYNRVVYDVLGFDKENVHSEYNKNLKIDQKISLLHSNSLEYYSDFYKVYADKDEEMESLDVVKYQSMGKNLSIPLSISTMDQLFDFIYKYKGFEIKLTTLSYSKIVIDEIQMYGPDLLAYLIYGLEQVSKLGGKIAILTATLAPFVKDLLCKNIDFKFEKDAFINDSIRHNLKVIDDYINEEDIVALYEKNKKLNRGNKILVVCNTVKQAQSIYESLKDSIDESELNILHSKFIKKDRGEKESQIIEFGKTYSDKEKKIIDIQNGIWVCTSIVEASLDIDFDYLFTELQDLSSLFQRLGRCNRKGVKSVDEANCYIYTEIDENLITKKNDKGNIFIDETIFNLSKEAICKIDGKISEKQKVDLINEYMTMENIKDSNYIRKYIEIYNYIKDVPLYEFNSKDIKLRNILTIDIIPGKIYQMYAEMINEQLKKLRENHNLSKLEKLKIWQYIEGLTVSVSPWDLNAYREALKHSKAITYHPVKLDKCKVFPVIECEYEDYGYRKKDFNSEIIREPDFI